jgi:hypothetical protein
MFLDDIYPICSNTGARPRPLEQATSPENSFTNHMLDNETSMLGYSQQVLTQTHKFEKDKQGGTERVCNVSFLGMLFRCI